ncbi:MAG: hypothetical protein Q7I98_02635, partial [Erysipelotrichaceae bacterium]|nr:hypothetical protein [Erysipelotrichaceae bacterium]
MIYKERHHSLFGYVSRHWFLYLLALPGLIYVIVFNYIPMYGLIIMFKNYNFSLGFFRSPWVGLDNFIAILSNTNFYRVLWNTVILNLISMT